MYNLSNNSWVYTKKLPKDLILDPSDFEKLWNQHPKNKEKTKIFGKECTIPRYQKTYLNDYSFSGYNKKPEKEIPDLIKPLFAFATKNDPQPFNQVLINWYENGHDHIGLHSDDEKEIVPESDIFSCTYSEKGVKRIFRIKDKKTKETVKDIEMTNGVFMIMGGKMQEEYLHQVPKISGKKGENTGKRINITFRKIKN